MSREDEDNAAAAHALLSPKVDRRGWGPGPWDGEPDRVEFSSHGFPCIVYRCSSGHLCGYVGVPRMHPAVSVHKSLLAHGGVTWDDELPDLGRPDHFWIGFDCGHSFDLIPDNAALTGRSDRTYKDVAFVGAECAGLASQIAEVGAALAPVYAFRAAAHRRLSRGQAHADE